MAKFTVYGSNPAKVVERARARGVPLTRVRVREGELTFCTKRAHTPTMIAILGNMCYHKWNPGRSGEGEKRRNSFTVTGDFGWKYLLSRASLGVFAVLFLISCLWLNGRVLTIEIRSDNDPLVASLLAECGIKQGQKVQDIKEVENFLNRRLDARYVFVRRQGVKLSVEVWAKNGQPLEEAQTSIVAPCDGVVQSVILLSGTSLVKAGDEVRAGDVLIEGKITSENGGEIACKAVGQVFLECEVTRTFEYETLRRSPFRTGRSLEYTEIDFLFGRYGRLDNPYTDFETEVAESVLNFIFPVRCRKIRVFEIGYLEETIDFEKVKDFVLAEKTRLAVEESEDEVLSTRTEVSGDETKTISVIMRTLIKCGGTFGNANL